ncbi:hypothetical protein EYF80_057431 [Liparis tanakae]|uniref:Uncharacterized protein n=1 Tax=Liparis tanakae TaxID=230148 RepID=A0A4Z2EUC9_9TELE|nr:hypothetical protein EYF80_057431 [Liparis tanakae]
MQLSVEQWRRGYSSLPSPRAPPPESLHQSASTREPPPERLHQSASTREPPPEGLHQSASLRASWRKGFDLRSPRWGRCGRLVCPWRPGSPGCFTHSAKMADIDNKDQAEIDPADMEDVEDVEEEETGEDENSKGETGGGAAHDSDAS